RGVGGRGEAWAEGGRNPPPGDRVVDAIVCPYPLAWMTTAGLYETSGDWLYDIGLPGRAESVVGSSPSLRGRADWELSPRRWTARETALRGSSSPSSFPNAWEWIFSSRNLRNRMVAPGESITCGGVSVS